VIFAFQIQYIETNKHEIASCQPDDRKLGEALDAVGLSRPVAVSARPAIGLFNSLPAEQQRIAFARALVPKPDWLFLDEATSAVDEATEARLD
jgi:putative ATP-binding cassette transporter